MNLPNPDHKRQNVGLALFWVGVALGTLLLAAMFLVPPLFSKNPGGAYLAMLAGAVFAVPAGLMYLTVPRLLDRYDPEPWYALLGCLVWGGFAAGGFSALINSFVQALATGLFDAKVGQIVGAVVSAPLVEEFWKCLGVFGVFIFLRREFDGVVDGIMYATFTALGFAMIENIVYYARAAEQGAEAFAATLIIRGVLAPWGHPLYTSMFGIGIGIARETTTPALRYLAPLLGYGGAVFLHAAWNGSAVFAGFVGEALFFITLPLWFLFVLAFLIMVIFLVRRRGQIIRRFLEDEIHIGNMTREEVDLTCKAFGLMQARSKYGNLGVEFVRAAARLSLSKWHVTRANQGKTMTVSASFIVPLRQRLAELRTQIYARYPQPQLPVQPPVRY